MPKPLPAQPLPIDCFYVYPTVDMSPQPGQPHRLLRPRAADGDGARPGGSLPQRLQRLRSAYRQATIGSYLRSAEVRDQYLAVAASDVADAFLHYMGQYNQGRKVVLIGHSQGAEMVTRLLKRYFDNDPVMRERLLIALPIGGNIEVPVGQKVGGTFAHLPLCTSADETGCVVGYRSVVAGTAGAKKPVPPPGEVSACVNPTALGTAAHPTSRTYFLLNERLRKHIKGADGVTTPFLMLRDFYRADCVEGPLGIFSLAMSLAGAPDVRENPIDFDSSPLPQRSRSAPEPTSSSLKATSSTSSPGGPRACPPPPH